MDWLPGMGGEFSITCGRSKLIPLIEGYLEMINLRHCPVPPATSTKVDIPSYPVYTSSIFFIWVVHTSFIALLNTWFSSGSFPKYSNLEIPWTFLNRSISGSIIASLKFNLYYNKVSISIYLHRYKLVVTNTWVQWWQLTMIRCTTGFPILTGKGVMNTQFQVSKQNSIHIEFYGKPWINDDIKHSKNTYHTPNIAGWHRNDVNEAR